MELRRRDGRGDDQLPADAGDGKDLLDDDDLLEPVREFAGALALVVVNLLRWVWRGKAHA